ncbi:TonB-dependent receptor [soil metagenome]
MRNLKYLIFVCLFYFQLDASAQSPGDSIQLMKEVKISGERFSSNNKTARTEKLDSSNFAKLLNANLADQLNREGNLFIKSYGSGSLSTIALRGTGAAHSALLWNGLQICSPMHGLYDLSLLPTFLLDNITLQYGGSSSSGGNGAVGGAIHLNSDAGSEKKIGVKILSGFGSYGFLQNGISMHLAKNKLFTTTRFYSVAAVNHYSYINPEGNLTTLKNSSYRQNAVSHDLRYGSKDNNFNLHLWYLNNKRKIPPHMLAASSAQEQEDHSFRAATEWYRHKDRWQWALRSGYSTEYLRYKDPATDLDEKSNSRSFQSDGDLNWNMQNGWTFGTQISLLHSEAQASGYPEWKQLNQLNQVVQSTYHRKHLEVNTNLKFGFYNGNALPLLPSLGMLLNISKATGVRMNIASIYRIPTLNDLYWRPGGNPDLKPEHGTSSAVSLFSKYEKSNLSLKAEAGVFYSKLKEVLVWLPASDGVYHVYNIQEVISKGVEGNLSAAWSKKDFHISVTISPQYNLSTIEKTAPQFNAVIGKQLIYTPKVLFKSRSEIKYKSWSLLYDQGYTGYRYVTSDESQWLKPFAVTDISLGWEKKIGAIDLTFLFTIKNALDKSYQVIAWRAMPGRNYQAGVMMSFH